MSSSEGSSSVSLYRSIVLAVFDMFNACNYHAEVSGRSMGVALFCDRRPIRGMVKTATNQNGYRSKVNV